MHQRDVEPEKDMKSRELSADKLTDLSSDQLQALHISQSLLTRVEQASGPLQPTEQAVRAWCDFAIAQANSDVERLSRVGVAYSAIPPNPLQVGAGSDTNDIGLQMLTLYAAGFCYLLADKPDLAEPLFRRCIDASPGGPKFRRRLTECLIRQGKKSEAVEAFAEYDRLQVGPADERWLSPLVLELGFEWMNQRSVADAVEMAAFNARGRPLGEGLVRWFVPWFDKMSKIDYLACLIP